MEVFDKMYFDQGIERRGTNCIKWDLMLRETGDEDMTPMWVADMDFSSPPAIRQALEKAAAQGTWGYTFSGEEDREALTGYWKRWHQVDLRPEWIQLSPCVVTGLRVCVQALTHPGDGVLIFTPVYGPFFDAVRESGRNLVESLLTEKDGLLRMDLEEVKGHLSAGHAKLVMICNPHNPCGRAWDRQELEELLSLCRQFDVPLVSDEIHADFVFAPSRHESVLGLAQEGDRVVMLCAASKTFNVAGLLLSAICCPDAKLRESISSTMRRNGCVSGNIFALAATRAAYTQCDAWLTGLRAYLMGNRDLVMEYARDHWPRIQITPLQATYLMWLDCRALELSQEDLMARLLQHHVKLNDGLFFGEAGRGFVRMNIACPRAQLQTALEKMTAVLGEG